MASEANKVLIVRSWTLVWVAIRSTPSASPPHLGDITRRDEQGTYVSKEQTKSNHRRKALVESLSKPPSRVERDASGGKKPQLWMHFFPSYRWKLAVPEPLLYNVFFF